MITILHPGSKTTVDDPDYMEPLNFELVAVFDLAHAFKNASMDEVGDFLFNGHPLAKGSPYLPVMILSTDEERKDVDSNRIPFGMFFATKRANPENNRSAMKSEQVLIDFREKYPFLRFEESWSSWDEVKEMFKLDDS